MPADLIIHNAMVFAGDEPTEAAIAVEAGRILAVGEMSEVRRRAGRRTESIDAGGGLVTPGFIDAHVHPTSGGMKLMNCSLQDATNLEEALEAIAVYDAARPDQEWIWGGGWAMAWFEHGVPSAAELDRIVPDRPVFLYNRDGHGAWVNSKALQLVGINAGTPDPPDGRIERLADGAPQGTLHEGAMTMVEAVLPQPSSDDWDEALRAGQEYLLSFGVTGWQDADVQAPQEKAYLSLAGRGELVASVVGALWWDRYQGVEQIEDLVGRRALIAPGYRPTTVKLMLDGVAENFTASMLEPYGNGHGGVTSNRGIDFIESDVLRRIVVDLDRLGFQCHFHAIGDRAVRGALDAVEAARNANGDVGLMHHIAHIEFVHEQDLGRFRPLRVAANAQPYWAGHEPQLDDLTIPFLNEAQVARLYPFGRLQRLGATMAMGSDWYVSTPNVLLQSHVAVNRQYPGSTEMPLLPDNSLTLAQALNAFTIGSAMVNRVDDRVGSIAIGKDADLVILDRDPFHDSPIGETEVVTTLIRGKPVYQR